MCSDLFIFLVWLLYISDLEKGSCLLFLSLSLGHTETAARTQFTHLCSLSFIYQQTGLGASGKRERERALHCELFRKKSGRREIAAVLATTRVGAGEDLYSYIWVHRHQRKWSRKEGRVRLWRNRADHWRLKRSWLQRVALKAPRRAGKPKEA